MCNWRARLLGGVGLAASELAIEAVMTECTNFLEKR
jgi:hypothetical protein